MDRQRPRAARRRCLAAAAALAVLCAAGAAAPAAAAAGGDADMWAWLRRGGAVVRSVAHESCACCTAALARLRAGACARACCACGSGTIPTHARAAPRRTAQIAVEPGVSPGGVRGALATKDIPAGGLIASIPIPLTIHFKQPSGHADLLVRQYPEIPCPCWPLHPPPGLHCLHSTSTNRTQAPHLPPPHTPLCTSAGRLLQSGWHLRRATPAAPTRPTSPHCRC